LLDPIPKPAARKGLGAGTGRQIISFSRAGYPNV
jgi:hypothetical protein